MSLFVTFEGVEGAGKSTHVRLLAQHLRAAGRTVVETREPGGTPAGAAIRRLVLANDGPALEPLAELHLYCADRAQHVATVVRPALAAGRVVLCDRFSDSTLAYQGYARGLDLATVRTLDTLARDGVAPDLTFLLDCPPAEGLRRAQERNNGTDRFESAPLEFHERVRAGFFAIAAAEPARFRVVDVTQPRDVVAAVIARETDRRLAALGAHP